MVALTRLIAFAATAAALSNDEGLLGPTGAIDKRTYPQVTNDLSVLSTSVATLSSALAQYTSGLGGLGPIINAESALESQIKKTTSDTNGSPAVTADQAQTVCTYFSSKLIPIIKATLNLLVAKKAPLESAGVQSVIQGDLSSLSSEAKALATALIAKAPVAKKPCASSASSTVISLFNSAKAQFA